MKNKKFIIIIFFTILFVSNIALANSNSVQFNGNNEVTVGEENVITLKIQNNEPIGVIEGIINYDSNIKDLKVSSSYNGWTATYNDKTGKFNAFNAEGTSNGDVLQITYKLSENASKGSIMLNNIQLTTISYETIEIKDTIEKTITKALVTSKSTIQEISNNKNTEIKSDISENRKYTGNQNNTKSR